MIRLFYFFCALVSLVGCGGENNENSQNYITVFIRDGAVQCEPGRLSPEQTAQVLIEGGVDVLQSSCGYLTGVSVVAVCGGPDLGINLHLIHSQNVIDAEALDFAPVSSLFQDEGVGYDIIDCPE